MRRFSTLVPIIILYFWALDPSGAQTLPLEMRFSDDGKRLILGGNETEGFYDESIVRSIDLQFEQANYWTLLSNNYLSGTDLLATMTVDGVTYDSVGVRFKGATSYFANNSQKKSFNVTLDFVKPDQEAMGYQTLNLNCGFDDPSSIREVLYNHLGRYYSPSLKSNFVTLTLNGENWGPYANVQQINGDYLDEWFLSNEGTRWRALKQPGGGPGGGGGFGTGFSTLNYLGTDTSNYKPYYTLKKANKENPWQDLVTTCVKLNNLPLNQLEDSLKYYMDVDKALWFLAHEIVFTDEDSYVWKGGMDYYLYWEPESGRMIPLEYDGNSCLRTNGVNWSPFYNQNDVKFPLMNRLFAVPGLRQRYLAHVRTIISQYMVPGEVHARIDAYVAQIGSLVQGDPKKIYTYNQFLTAKEEVKTFITNRRNYLLNHAEINSPGLAIAGVDFAAQGVSGQTPEPGEEVLVTANVSGTVGIDKVNLYYGPGFVGVFEKTPMYDDGLHGDGSAGDGLFGANIPGFAAGTYVRYYVEAIAANTPKTATYEPAGAEHDVFIYRVNLGSAVDSEVVINELMASNEATATDPNGDYDDWIELYNNSADLSLDLGGYFLSDDPNNLLKWSFPAGTSIGPNDYLIVWADEDGDQDGLHANFKLSASGENLFFLDPDGNIADEVAFGNQETDKGYARMPNGTGDFVIQAPTFNANNETASGVAGQEALKAARVYPNPAREEIVIELPVDGPVEFRISDLWGRVLKTGTLVSQHSVLSVRELEEGMYFLILEGLPALRIAVQR